MSVEGDIFNALKGLVANRVFPDVAPITTMQPYITYAQVGGEALTLLDGSLPDKKHGRFQINVWGSTRSSASALMLQVELAMSQVTVFHARPVSAPSSDYDSDMLTYSAMQDFSVHSSR